MRLVQNALSFALFEFAFQFALQDTCSFRPVGVPLEEIVLPPPAEYRFPPVKGYEEAGVLVSADVREFVHFLARIQLALGDDGVPDGPRLCPRRDKPASLDTRRDTALARRPAGEISKGTDLPSVYNGPEF